MKIIGLTGNIAAGKTTVSNLLRDLGAAVIDADEIARDIVAVGTVGWQRLREEFGEQYFFDNGQLDRKKLGNLVFHDGSALAKLNSITHPLIRKEIEKRFEELRKTHQVKVVVLDAALLIETGWYKMVDEVWLVIAEDRVRLKRLMERNALSEEEALSRMKSQWDQEVKKKYAKRIIDNSGDIEYTKEQVNAYWNAL